MSKTGTDPNKILMGDLKPELAAKADKLSSKFAPKPRKAATATTAADTKAAAPVQSKPIAVETPAAAAPKAAKATKAPAEDTLVQMNIRIPASLKRDIDRIVFEKKYAGEEANIKSLVSQWIEESVKKELRKNG